MFHGPRLHPRIVITQNHYWSQAYPFLAYYYNEAYNTYVEAFKNDNVRTLETNLNTS